MDSILFLGSLTALACMHVCLCMCVREGREIAISEFNIHLVLRLHYVLADVAFFFFLIKNWSARLVLALGAEAKLDVVPGSAEHAFPFLTLEDVHVSSEELMHIIYNVIFFYKLLILY